MTGTITFRRKAADRVMKWALLPLRVPRRPAAVPDLLRPGDQGSEGAPVDPPDRPSPPGGGTGGRHRERDPGHRRHHPPHDDVVGAGGGDVRHLPRGVRQGEARLRRAVRRRHADGRPLHHHGDLRLHSPGPADEAVLRLGRRGGALHDLHPRRRPDDGGHAPDRADDGAGSRPGAGDRAVEGHAAHHGADGVAGDPDGDPPRHVAHHRGDRPPALHRAGEPVLAVAASTSRWRRCRSRSSRMRSRPTRTGTTRRGRGPSC